MPCKERIEPDPGVGGGGGTGGNDEEPSVTPRLFIDNEIAEEVSGGGRRVIFTVTASPAPDTNAISFSYATSNGTALAGTHYTSKSGTGNIAVDDSSVTISVVVLEPDIYGVTKQFTMTISAPTNATIADGTATGTIKYGPADLKPWERSSYSSIAPEDCVVYDQFRSYNNVTGPDHNDADCVSADQNGCTGYAGALMMSILEFKRHHNRRIGFRARRLLTDSGFSVGGNTWYDNRIFQQLTVGVGASTAGALTCDNVRRTLDKVPEISDDASLGSTSARWRDLQRKIKKRIVQNHCVYVSSLFYADLWNTTGMEAYFYLRKKASWPSTGSGHSWILTGWNDNVTVKGRYIGGAFRIQSSHGKAWSDGGRAWLPYTHIIESFNGGSSARNRSSSQGYPWFRFFYPVW